MKKDEHLISVIVPSFNVEEYLSVCLLSIINQTYKNLEIILVNDGSTDTTGKICDKYASRDKRIKVIHRLNSGVSGARNTGLLVATGDYITFVDADDILPKKAIQQLAQIAEQSNADCITGALQTFIDETAVDSDQNTDTYAVELVDRDSALEQLLYQKRIINGPVAKLYKASLLKNMEFKVGITVAEDLYFNYQVLKKVKSVAMTNSTVYLYRLRDGSAMRRAFNKERMDGLYIAELILKDTEQSSFTVRPAKDRLFMEAIFIMLNINGDKEFRAHARRCMNIIKRYRFAVFSDKKAPLKHRVLAGLSIVQPHLVMTPFRLKKTFFRQIGVKG